MLPFWAVALVVVIPVAAACAKAAAFSASSW